MEIRVNPLELSKPEREALAGFILTYPGPGQMERTPIVIPDSPELREAIQHIDPAAGKLEVMDPALVFASTGVAFPPIPQAPVSNAGPHLVIPNPEPAAPPAPPAPAPGMAATDKQGIPWDPRIHATTKTFNADGTWRKKRGIEAATIATVEAELKALMAIPSPATAAPPAPTIPAPPAATQAAPPPPVPPAAGPNEAELRAAFVALIGKASAAIQSGKLQEHELASTCAFAGVGSLPLLGSRLDLVPQVAAAIDQIIARNTGAQ